MVRGQSDEPDVVVLKTVGAAPASGRGLRRRRPKRIEETAAEEPLSVPVCRGTVVRSEAFPGRAEARAWMERCTRNEGARDLEVAWAVRTLNLAVRAQRLAAGDPYVHEVSAGKARTARLGFGTGEELVSGQWSEAVEIPEPRSSRREMLAPQQQVAEILSERKPAYPSEELFLRAQLDLDEGRQCEAALQLRITIEALAAELERDGDEAASALRARESRARELAKAALQGDLDDRQAESLHSTMKELGRFLRRRRHL